MINLVTILTPLKPGTVPDVEPSSLAPFDGLETVHFARCVVIGSVHGNFPGLSARRRQLRMTYVLFTAAIDTSVGEFVESLRTALIVTADAIWGNCVGYPSPAEKDNFHHYFTHNQLDIPHSFLAYRTAVPEVKRALGLRNAHRQLALDVQNSRGADDALTLFARAFV